MFGEIKPRFISLRWILDLQDRLQSLLPIISSMLKNISHDLFHVSMGPYIVHRT